MRDYQLGFISNENIFNHVKETVELYRNHINLKEFNKNIIDPIKLTFGSKVYGKSLEEIIESECTANRQNQYQSYRVFSSESV